MEHLSFRLECQVKNAYFPTILWEEESFFPLDLWSTTFVYSFSGLLMADPIEMVWNVSVSCL